jgi:hypothetical protein
LGNIFTGIRRKKGHKEWEKYRKWGMRERLELDREHCIKLNYKYRFEKIKNLFSSFLGSDFLQ